MSRPRSKAHHDTAELAELMRQFVDAVADAYLHPIDGCADENGKTYLNLLSDEFEITPLKIRKLLITAGVYETPTSRQVNELYNNGKSIKEIKKHHRAIRRIHKWIFVISKNNL